MAERHSTKAIAEMFHYWQTLFLLIFRWQFIICSSCSKLKQTLCWAKRISCLNSMTSWYV